MNENWFEVSESTDVVDAEGTAIGRLRPGHQYKAVEVRPFDIVVGGPGGTLGSIPKSAATMVAAGTAAAEAEAMLTPAASATSPSGRPAWLLPAAVGLVAVSAVVLGVAVMLADSGEEPDDLLATSDTSAVVTTLAPTPTAAPEIATTSTALPTTTIAATTIAPETVPPTTVAPTTLPPETAPPPTVPPPTAAPATVAPAPPAEAPLTFVEARPPGPHIPPAVDTALSFQPTENTAGLSVDICPSGSTSLYLYGVDRNGVPIEGSGYGVVDAAGIGRMSVWYRDASGSLVAFDQPGDPYAVTVNANALALRGARFDLDLVYTWTWSAAHAVENCALIDKLVADLAV